LKKKTNGWKLTDGRKDVFLKDVQGEPEIRWDSEEEKYYVTDDMMFEEYCYDLFSESSESSDSSEGCALLPSPEDFTRRGWVCEVPKHIQKRNKHNLSSSVYV